MVGYGRTATWTTRMVAPRARRDAAATVPRLLRALVAVLGVGAAPVRLLAGAAEAPGTIDPAAVKTVHLVHSNHLDIGFSDLAARVLNRYLVGGPGT
eukprot:SAG31_NODE_28948_length_403_cov_0.680921_2_plen_96_part_01